MDDSLDSIMTIDLHVTSKASKTGPYSSVNRLTLFVLQTVCTIEITSTIRRLLYTGFDYIGLQYYMYVQYM